MSLAYWLNTAWMWKCGVEYQMFRRATRAVAETQAAALRSVVVRNRRTEFGKRYGFSAIGSVRQYQRLVPLSTYDSYHDWIRRIAAGAPNVLTHEPVGLLEPTSATTGGEKLIPYTASLRRQFQRGLAAWIADVMLHRPAVRRGRAYWSVSPCFGSPRRTSGGIPIGFDDDTAYLGGAERLLVGRLLAVPSGVAGVQDIENFRYATLVHLLRTDDLALISVWNPTFLTALLDGLGLWHERLCRDIRRGELDLPATESLKADQAHFTRFQPNPQRAARLHSIFTSDAPPAHKLHLTWPRLALISCWADAAAAWGIPAVKRLFPSVEVQPKGLLATEAFVSLPLVDRPGAALALRSHFFEFLRSNSDEQDGGDPESCGLAHELDRGGRYRVIVTTAGGLYRYQLRDEVEVVGFGNQCPLLRFLGKVDHTSDLVGEKLGEPHVRNVITHALAAQGLSSDFAILVPVQGRPPHYRLCVYQPGGGGDVVSKVRLAAALQAGLEENPYYRYAIRLGQLAPAEVELIHGSTEAGRLSYERRCLQRGLKLGDIKPTTLDTEPIPAEEPAPKA